MDFKSRFAISCIFLPVIFSFFNAHEILAKDLGVFGHVQEIKEQDLLKQIKSKLVALEADGSLKEHNKKITQKVKKSILTPSPLANISKTIEAKSFYHDPSFVVAEDITDHLGNFIAKKGMIINPLESVSLSENLVFIDSNDEQQVNWASKEKGTLILVAGAPQKLSKNLDRPVYFDQKSLITSKFKITQVPARISQPDKKIFKLLVEEIKLEEEVE